MRWDDVVAAMQVVERRGSGDPAVRDDINVRDDIDVRDVQYDSRRVEPGYLFFAFAGARADGASSLQRPLFRYCA